jgi:hypothetical protein
MDSSIILSCNFERRQNILPFAFQSMEFKEKFRMEGIDHSPIPRRSTRSLNHQQGMPRLLGLGPLDLGHGGV